MLKIDIFIFHGCKERHEFESIEIMIQIKVNLGQFPIREVSVGYSCIGCLVIFNHGFKENPWIHIIINVGIASKVIEISKTQCIAQFRKVGSIRNIIQINV
ncbi:MAG: hypothetical protein CG442_359 [Methylococcaceae bacterium NSO1]|nr:MAG: hypothetical protein CG442_359 [Methylococcaceae bacterium NSO1]